MSGFLKDRTFCVRVGSDFSPNFRQEEGVPQGSVLSCTLFALAINLISEGIPVGVHETLYVDYLGLYCSGPRIASISRNSQLALNAIERNASSVGFKFSDTKTVAMHFCRVRRCHVDPDCHCMVFH